MNLTRCNQGHFYDADKFSSCPHCNRGQASQTPVSDKEIISELETKPDPAIKSAIKSQTPAQSTPAATKKDKVEVEEIGKTVGIFDVKEFSAEPVVGWLVCISGKHIGCDFKLKAGRNFVGRDKSMDIVLGKDSTVSRIKHSIIVYEPKGNMFIMQAGESKELSYLNENVVLSPVELKAYDIITLGESQLMFVPFCSENFKWDDEKNNEE